MRIRDRNELAPDHRASNNRRKSQVPAPAVITAPISYTKDAAVKKLVDGFERFVPVRPPPRVVRRPSSAKSFWGFVDLCRRQRLRCASTAKRRFVNRDDLHLEQIRVFKAGGS